MQYVAALSYGKDSLAMLEVIHRLGLPLDRIITVEEWAIDNLRAVLPEIVKFEESADAEIFKRLTASWYITHGGDHHDQR